jgi:flagellar biosynthesis GTPase FlhF
LTSSLDASNKGFKMMAKLGYKPGSTLGKSADARTEPLHLSMKEDRAGVGMDSEKKRKMREALEATERQEKKVKIDQVDYRERLRQEREEQRLEGQVHAAQKVAERLDTEAEEEQEVSGAKITVPLEKRPLKSINVLWRGLIKDRREREAQEHMKREVQNSLTYRRPDYNDSDEDEEDRGAVSKKRDAVEFFEQDLEDEDLELDEFNQLTSADRLAKVAAYLRSKHLYCFWCKTSYPDPDFLGCPGTTEEAHEL